ncbi:expressed unknown protein [Seminavis robusta]|uniref:G-protein coupled receptors family 2 profile 2 domain-containing protein n=1 Tax=Seminavis robusta TaxID=568900 RepID=A0A9N8DIH6_9STRA|nr:expressed unknown protein [Seminavis robusta]|eukprot:Sro162_g072960.1 n/a (930) ;mRNA; f:84086-86875
MGSSRGKVHFHRRAWKAWVLLLQMASIFLAATVEATRNKDGCFDAFHMTCDRDDPMTGLVEDILEIEETCYWIEDYFFNRSVFTHLIPAHVDFFNQYTPEDAECLLVQKAFHHCVFCQQKNQWERDACANYAYAPICGDQPTLEQVLADNDKYPQYKTPQDVNQTCVILKALDELNFSPRTYHVCQESRLVRHLCPGECQGGCFDEELYAPSCHQPQNSSLFMEDFDPAICAIIQTEAFRTLNRSQVMDPANHLEYLLGFEEQSPECLPIRNGYQYCPWCTGGDFCFQTEESFSCEPPPTPPQLSFRQEDAEEICYMLFWNLIDFDNPRIVYDLEAHKDHLTYMEKDTRCELARMYYHRCAWCDEFAVQADCLLSSPCDTNATVPEGYNSTTMAAYDGPTEEFCENVNGLFGMGFIHATTEYCLESIFLARMCPETLCPQPPKPAERSKDYLGTTNQAQRKALIWASRTSAMLAFGGASYVLYDTLSDPKARSTVFHSLLIAMASFDIVTASAWFAASAPIDKEQAGHVEGAMGNQATCKAQAFFVQLGITSIFYNASLSIYYFLIIVKGWREFQLKKIQLYLHAAPLAVGLGLAFGAIPIYHWIEYGCHILPPPEGKLWHVLLFVVIPVALSILAITGFMLLVYCKVRQQSATSRRWTMGVGQASKMEQAVFWQCFLFMLAFYITWPITFSVYLGDIDDKLDNFGLSLTVAFVAPLQGFNNFLVYIRPKLANRQRSTAEVSSMGYLARIWTKVTSIVSSKSHSSSAYGSMDPSAAIALQRDADISSLQAQTNTELPIIDESVNSKGGSKIVASISHSSNQSAGIEDLSDQQYCNKDSFVNEHQTSGDVLEQNPLGVPVAPAASDTASNEESKESTPLNRVMEESLQNGLPVDSQEQVDQVSIASYPLFEMPERKDWSQYLLQGNIQNS